MIKFFRHIRQRMLTENPPLNSQIRAGKMSKYLLYAIGEIVLVVIGILIALQINTWKTEKENQRIEHDYYCQLLDDLDLDKFQITNLSQEARIIVQRGKQLLKDLHTQSKDKDELLGDFIKTARSDRFVSTRAAFTDLMSSGNLSLVRNRHIKKSLIEYYSGLDNINTILSDNASLKIGHMVDWDDVLEFGWQSPGISPGLELDKEIMDLLPKNQWHLDKNSAYFKNFQEVVFICIIITDRELQLYALINENMQSLYQELDEACQHN